jgi:hypothetical protein
VLGPKATHRVAKSKHGPHSSEGLVRVAFDMFLECESTIKEESQVPPSGSLVEGVMFASRLSSNRGQPSVTGIFTTSPVSQ